MKINEKGLALIKEFEGCRLKAYKCPAGIWTIGYGDTQNVHEGLEITQAEADKRLLDALGSFERGVSKLLAREVSPCQFSALVAFAYNVGLGNLKVSTLLRCTNKGNWPDAAVEFMRWNKVKGVPVVGLTRRRAAERALFELA